MQLNLQQTAPLTGFFASLQLLPANAMRHLGEMACEQFAFREQLTMAESIHLHIKVPAVSALPHQRILEAGGEPQNAKAGYIKYAFPGGVNFIFSDIPVSQEEKAGKAVFSYPHLDHIGIDIRAEHEAAYRCFNNIPLLAAARAWPVKKQGGEGKKVYCCHVQVNEKYWVYPAGGVYWEFAFGRLLVSDEVFGCDLRPASPAAGLPEEAASACCGGAVKEAPAATVVSIHYKMRNSHGEIMEDRMHGEPVSFVQGGGSILPALEAELAGLKAGDEKRILVSQAAYPGLGSDLDIEVKVAAVRPATAAELQSGRPSETAAEEQCGPGCNCE